jgi:hypothetical protein
MNTRRLLSCFFQGCKKHFDFLKNEYGFISLAGVSAYEKGRCIISDFCAQTDTEYPFNVTVRYESDDIFFEILYGDYNYALEFYITYRRRHRFELHDLVQVLNITQDNAPITFHSPSDHHGAPQTHHINSFLQTAHDILNAYADELLHDPDDDFLERAQIFKDKKLQERVRLQYEREKEAACLRAAEAFKEQDYKRAIMLYRPYKADLNPRELNMFSLAISALGQ